MKNILVMTGSIRKKRAGDGVLGLVLQELKKHPELNVTVADLRELALPLLDSADIPSTKGFTSEYANVEDWRRLVAAADGVIMLTPEYNAGLSAAQKNALDWLYEEWRDKPVAVVGYSHHGAPSSRSHLSDVLRRLGAHEISPATALAFNQTISMDGEAIDQTEITKQLTATITALEAAL